MKTKRIGRKIHRFILKAITGIAVITFLSALLSVDGPYWWQALIALVLSGGWIVLFTWVNYEGEEDGK